MNKAVVERIKQHSAAGGRTLSVVPGDGYELLSGGTCCTYLHDQCGIVSAVLLETSPRDDSDEAADFLCQQVVFAFTPSAKMREMGLRGVRSDRLLMITFLDGLPKDRQERLHGRLLSICPKTFDMGHVSEWSDAAMEAMSK